MTPSTASSDAAAWLLAENHDPDLCVDHHDDVPEQGFGLFVSFVFTVNMVTGAGIVGLPYAFYHAGAIFSLTCPVLATMMAMVTLGYIVEVAGWCEGWVSANEMEKILVGRRAERWLAPVSPDWFEYPRQESSS
jgi:hypothetical protein